MLAADAAGVVDVLGMLVVDTVEETGVKVLVCVDTPLGSTYSANYKLIFVSICYGCRVLYQSVFRDLPRSIPYWQKKCFLAVHS